MNMANLHISTYSEKQLVVENKEALLEAWNEYFSY